ncbi:Sec-independent protein translocase protein TatB [Salmonella enterica]|nr:twin-arginine translocase subunit TatB [Salmonella enterica subsp. enterica]MDJ1936610.1 Sec-independent protein translocase protein TatB [Salmonella enterica]
MFDIGFSELLLVFVIGLIVLGPQRLPVAVKTVAGWIRALRSLATTVQNELTQELKASMDELRQAAESMKRTYSANDPEQASDEAHTIHNPVVKGNETQHEGVTPAAAETQASAPEQKPEPVKANVPESTETASVATIDAEKKSAAPVVESSPSSSDKP